jgi:hypothetical protein
MSKYSNKICCTRLLAVSLYEASTGKLNRVCRIKPNPKCSRKKPGDINRRRGTKSLDDDDDDGYGGGGGGGGEL